jgi:hypothetical protein
MSTSNVNKTMKVMYEKGFLEGHNESFETHEKYCAFGITGVCNCNVVVIVGKHEVHYNGGDITEVVRPKQKERK